MIHLLVSYKVKHFLKIFIIVKGMMHPKSSVINYASVRACLFAINRDCTVAFNLPYRIGFTILKCFTPERIQNNNSAL